MVNRISPKSAAAILSGIALLAAVACSDNFNPALVVSPPNSENIPPIITVDQPNEDLAISQGDGFIIRWADSDPDDNALIDIDLVKTDGSLLFPVASGLRENDSSGEDRFVVDTRDIVLGEYNVRLTISDGINNISRAFALLDQTEERVRVTITQQGLGQTNRGPRVFVAEPQVNIGVSQSDILTVSIRPTTDVPGPADPGPAGRYDQDGDSVEVVVLLDLDEDPLNDDFSNDDDPGHIIIERAFIAPGRFDQIDFNITIDVQEIPVRQDGSPYFVRVSASDGLNVSHSYAQGNVHVLGLIEGSAGNVVRQIDLAEVGRTLSGAVFRGAQPLGNLGTKMTTALDQDNDGADDMILVAQYGNARQKGNLGEAFLIFGTPGRRFGGTISTSSISNDALGFGRVRGSVFHPFTDQLGANTAVQPGDDRRIGFADPALPYTLGIRDVVAIPDLGNAGNAANGCNLPELVFGLPHSETMGTVRDDDPGDNPTFGPCFGCYPDVMPNNFCNAPGDDPTNLVDYVEGGATSDRVGPGNGFAAEERMGVVALFYGENNITAAPTCATISAPTNEVHSLSAVGQRTAGCRFSTAIYDYVGASQPNEFFDINPLNAHYGFNVAVLPDVDLNGLDEMIISAPRNEIETRDLLAFPGVIHPHLASRLSRGNITVFLGQDFAGLSLRPEDAVYIPYVSVRSAPSCSETNPAPRFLETELDVFAAGATHANPINNVITQPGWFRILGETADDKLGFATSAGDFNQDGPADILCGAPFADPRLDTDNNGFPDTAVFNAGTVYIVFLEQPFGHVDLSTANNITDTPPTQDTPPITGGPNLRHPMLRIFGESDRDHLGLKQATGNDIDGDGIDDVVFASKDYNGANLVDNGAVAIVYGGQRIDGDRVFSEIATPRLRGTVIFGSNTADFAGTDIAAAGDFNGDGLGDLLVTAPGEERFVTGEDKPRRGVVYLIFGGLHLVNKTFTLSQVGTAVLPGVAMVGPYQSGTQDSLESSQSVFVRSAECRPFDDFGNLTDSECLCDPEVEEGCLLLENDGAIALVQLDDAAPSRVGFVGDVNSDGFDDIMVGNPTADLFDPKDPAQSRRRDAGEAYLIYGNNFGANTIIHLEQ